MNPAWRWILLTDAAALQVPDRICRELFQIYREALHNVKKHARATHVVVKLWQNDSQVVLVIDDNGERVQLRRSLHR